MKTISLKQLSIYSLPFFLIFMIFSCDSGKKKAAESADEFESAASELRDQVEQIIYEIPSPAEIPFIIQATGAEYIPELVNDLSKADKYAATNKIAALNLGVYATDIGYLVTYDKVQDALNYMEKCMDIGENLGLQSAIDMSIIEKFEANLSKKDTLGHIINDVIAHSDEYLKQSDRDNLAALVLGGTFIEGLYIATQLVDSYPKDILPDDARNLILTPLIKMILDQEKALSDMVAMLKNIEDKGDWIEGLINSLEELKGNYAELTVQEQISNNRADLVLTDRTLERITLQIKKIRTTVTY